MVQGILALGWFSAKLILYCHTVPVVIAMTSTDSVRDI